MNDYKYLKDFCKNSIPGEFNINPIKSFLKHKKKDTNLVVKTFSNLYFNNCNNAYIFLKYIIDTCDWFNPDFDDIANIMDSLVVDAPYDSKIFSLLLNFYKQNKNDIYERSKNNLKKLLKKIDNVKSKTGLYNFIYNYLENDSVMTHIINNKFFDDECIDITINEYGASLSILKLLLNKIKPNSKNLYLIHKIFTTTTDMELKQTCLNKLEKINNVKILE